MIGGFLALLDDMAYFAGNLANTVATNGRQAIDAAGMATQKASGIITDDTAVVATGVTGIAQERETIVVAKIAAGSFFGNKLFLAILLLALDLVWPPASSILLLLGGAYLAYEATHELLHKFHLLHEAKSEHELSTQTPLDRIAARSPLLRKFLGQGGEGQVVTDMLTKDLVLSAEITILTLGVIASAPLLTKIILLGIVGLATTIMVYGTVWAIARADNLALHLMADANTTRRARMKRAIGTRLIAALPHLLRGLSYVGTVAMLVVGGQIIAHKTPFLHELHIPPVLDGLLVGFVSGIAIIGVQKLYSLVRHTS